MRSPVFLSAFLLVTVVSAGRTFAQTGQQLLAMSEARTQGGLPYRLFKPPVADGTKYPLVVYLHGAGQRGTDNMRHVTEWNAMLVSLLSNTNRMMHPAFVIAPQCPNEAGALKDQKWVDTSWSPGTYDIEAVKETPHLIGVRAAITALSAELPIDTDRIYVMGVSMGGFGTWDMISRTPELFAGAISADGGSSAKAAPRLRNVAAWAFHNSDDGIVNIKGDRDMMAALARAGGRPMFSEWSTGGHSAHERVGRNPFAWSWLFAQRRGVPATSNPSLAFSPQGGMSPGGPTVTIASMIPQAMPAIRYTLDGTVPTVTTGMAYAAPFMVPQSAIVVALAKAADWSFFHAEPYQVGSMPLPGGVPLPDAGAGALPADASADRATGVVDAAVMGTGGARATDAGAAGAAGTRGGGGEGSVAVATMTGGARGAAGAGGSAGGSGELPGELADGGCSCRVGGVGESSYPLVMAVGVVLALLVRRRRRRG